ncbi:MAG: PAAR domain-containing protein [Proteobacteria bacterium]|nr:PAAR domain-containing protein [Pseudomonadota bacterium]
MPLAHRHKDVCTGHGCFPSRSNVGGSPDVITNNLNQVRQGVDAYACHGCAVCPCHSSTVAAGSPTVITNNKQTARQGDPVACGGTCSAHSPNVNIGP